MMDEYTKDLMEQYTKAEVVDLCHELGLNIADNLLFKDVIDLLVEDLEDNGVPVAEDCSELMSDFLYVAMFVDEEGEIIDLEDIDDTYVEDESDDDRDAKLVPTEVESIDERLPECFGFADPDNDPACRKCKVVVSCQEQRVSDRPKCFGLLFSANSEQCKQCIERTNCKEVMENE